MTGIYAAIYNRLTSLASGMTVHFEQAKQGTTYPYVTFLVSSTTENYQREDMILEVDIWDKTTNTKTIDDMTDTIDGNGGITNATGLHRWAYSMSSTHNLKFYRINRLALPDPDENIRRRQLRYQIQSHKGVIT